jgi:hypothetical protein
MRGSGPTGIGWCFYELHPLRPPGIRQEPTSQVLETLMPFYQSTLVARTLRTPGMAGRSIGGRIGSGQAYQLAGDC